MENILVTICARGGSKGIPGKNIKNLNGNPLIYYSLKIAEAYEIKGVRIENIEEMEAKIKEVMDYDGPVICDVMTPEWQLIVPRVSSDKMPDGSLVSRPYDDMFPYLDRDELAANTIK